MIFVLLAAVLALSSLRVMTPSLCPPLVVREALEGWEVPHAAAV